MRQMTKMSPQKMTKLSQRKKTATRGSGVLFNQKLDADCKI